MAKLKYPDDSKSENSAESTLGEGMSKMKNYSFLHDSSLWDLKNYKKQHVKSMVIFVTLVVKLLP